MAKLDAKKAFHTLRKVYMAASQLFNKGRVQKGEFGEYRFYWDEPLPLGSSSKEAPKQWSFEISCRISGQSLWDGHIEEYHLHDIIGAQYKNHNDLEDYKWSQWETRFPKEEHEYYLDELNSWASDILG